jgi:hypothetical protein
MKIIICLLSLFALNAQAGITDGVYKPHTLVPTELQEEVLAAVYQKYPCVENLKEVATTFNRVRIDQGIVDQFFNIQFLAPDFSSNNQNTLIITAEAALYSFQNGKNTEVSDVRSTWGDNICP